jgi:hypothetical protein
LSSSSLSFIFQILGGGITQTGDGIFEVRAGTTPIYSKFEEKSWLFGTYEISLTF